MSFEVPPTWQRVTLGDVITLEYGRSLPEADRRPGPVPVYGSNGVVGWHDEALVRSCGIIIGRKGTAGSVTISTGPFWPIDTTYFIGIRQRVDGDWLAAVLHNARLGDLNEATGVPGLNRDNAYRWPVLLPPLDEQGRIAEVLRSVNNVIEAVEKTLHAAAIVRRSVLDAMVQKVLADNGTTVTALSDVAEVRTGLAKNKNRVGLGTCLPYLRVANVQDGRFDLTDIQKIEIAPENVERYLLQAGDVLLTEGGDYDKLGRGAVWRAETSPCLHQNHVFCVRPNTEVLLPDYFALLTQSSWGKAYFLSCAKRTTNLASINSSQLKAFPLPQISMAEQTAITETISTIDAMIGLDEQKLENVLQLRTALRSELLFGRVRVPAPVVLKKETITPAFKRAVFSAEIVQQLREDKHFGAVKHEKIVYLCEIHLDLQHDLDRTPQKRAAGPYDPAARQSVERVFELQRWFLTSNPDGKRVVYTPLKNVGGHKECFERYFGTRKTAIQSIIDLLRPLDTQQCEIVATLYAVWNNFLIDRHTPTDDEIVASVYDWHPKKQEIPRSRWLRTLQWMREKSLTPKGTGKKIQVPEA